MAETFLNGKVTLLRGDCLELLLTLEENSIDSCVTDPPYHLTSIVKRFGADTSAPCQVGKTGAYARASKGFMGKKWDGGDIAFRPELWAEVLRVLKPGAHLLAFSGTRTYHRMACAIEDAGFEIRDQIGWCYGSGFPKSHDISKAIDRRPGVTRHAEFAAELKSARLARGFTNSFDVSERIVGRRTGAVANWEKYQWPEAKWWPSLRDLLGMDPKWDDVIAQSERERIGTHAGDMGGLGGERLGQANGAITSSATEAAMQWQGWGTALKPAWEPIVLARKPLSESSIAANVLKHGTGAINIDQCRVQADDNPAKWETPRGGIWSTDSEAKAALTENRLGRWPANLIHDGSEEVLERFPETGPANVRPPTGKDDRGIPGFVMRRVDTLERGINDNGGNAARFFYTAKADSNDRLGSKHPTVKPLDLMQYLIRLITPRGGIVLDPFSGTGTTGEAAFREGMCAVLVEREPEYQADIVKRMGLCLSGPDERRAKSVKQLPPDDLPMFREAL